MSGSAFGPGADAAAAGPPMNAEQGMHLLALVAERQWIQALDYLDEQSVPVEFAFTVMAEMCAHLLGMVLEEKLEHPDDMWVLETNAPGAKPTRALQLVTAMANHDTPMVTAHLNVILNLSTHDFVDVLAEVMRLHSDLTRALAHKATGLPWPT